MTRTTKATRAFDQQIRAFKKASSQSGAKISKKEMETALTELSASTSGKVSKNNLQKAKDLFGSDIPMTRGGREALQAFIAQAEGGAASSSGPSHGTGVRTATSVADMRTMLRDDSFRESIFTAAFGATRSRSSSAQVTGVTKNADGGFDIDVELTHWRTGALYKEATVSVNAAGVPVDVASDTPDRIDPRDAKIASDGPIGPRHPGGGGHVFKVRADDPVDTGPDPWSRDPFDDTDNKIRSDGPIGGGGRPGGHVFKVRADDPIDSPPPRRDDDDGIRKVRADGPVGGGRPGGGRVFKVRADDPI